MIIQGIAVTLKSYMIGVIKNALETMSFLEKIPLLILDHTRVANFNIYVTKIHSALQLPIKDITPLQGSCLITLQEEMTHAIFFCDPKEPNYLPDL